MIKVIKLENKELKLSSSAAFLLVYKQQFKKEPLQDIMKISESMSEIDDSKATNIISNIDLEVIYNIAWALAKTANYKDVTDPMSFYLENGDFKPMEHIEDILELAISSITPDFEMEEVETQSKN